MKTQHTLLLNASLVLTLGLAALASPQPARAIVANCDLVCVDSCELAEAACQMCGKQLAGCVWHQYNGWGSQEYFQCWAADCEDPMRPGVPK